MNGGDDGPERTRRGDGRRDRGNRTGFTTGACAAAAARAAAQGLVSGAVPATVRCTLPNGQQVDFPVQESRLDVDAGHARAVVVKDAGDDPDATHGARLTVDVARLPGRAGEVLIAGGPGVGLVTREGLGLTVGEAAINPVPRQNIRDNLAAVAGALLALDGLRVEVSVPEGELMARRTLNARLGIVGGISILGTSGIVHPWSTAAFRASVVQAVAVAARQGQEQVVFTTGGRTEKFAMAHLPRLPEVCFVQMGDFVQTAFRSAIDHGFRHIIVGAMVGKLTKMAQGLAVTHAWRAEVDRGLLAEVAARVGAPAALVTAIAAAETARYAAEKLATLGLAATFHHELASRAIASLRTAYPGDYRLTVLVCDFDGSFICRAGNDLPGDNPPEGTPTP